MQARRSDRSREHASPVAALVFVLIGASILNASPAISQTYGGFVSTGDSLYAAKDFPASVSAYREAFAMQRGEPGDLYNAACSAALSGDTSQALAWLDSAVARGWTNRKHMENDADLASLHATEGWKTLTGRLRTIVEELEKKLDKPLMGELLAIYEDDQGIRREFMKVVDSSGWKSPAADSLGKIMALRDSLNLIKIRAILDEKGWVGPEKVGGQASAALFLVIQHSDLATQQKYLPMMREAAADGRAQKSSLALLEDRVALGEGRRQIYGSQIGTDETSGRNYILPLEDPDNVDQRRAEMGLGTLADYVKRWGISWDPETFKKEQTARESAQRPGGR